MLGSILRITGEWLSERGLLAHVKEKVSPATLKVLEKPPFSFAWHDSAPLEEVERVLYTLPKGRQLCMDLGHAAGRQLSGTVVAPVVKMALSLFGQTPSTIFENLDRFFSMVVRGFSFRYEPATAKTGTVIATIDGAGVHESLFQQIRGNLMTVYDLCSARGAVGEVMVMRHDGRGAEVRVPVRWE